MNKVAFYIHITDESKENIEIFHTLNEAVDGDFFTDASLFYNNVAFCPVTPRFGMFNSPNVWDYSNGVLICTTLANANFARGAINNFDLFYLFNKSEIYEHNGVAEKRVLQLLSISGDIKVITRNEEDTREFKRLTGKEPAYQLDNFNIQKMVEDICQKV